jgi:hypothetical protein
MSSNPLSCVVASLVVWLVVGVGVCCAQSNTLPPGFVNIRDVDCSIIVEMRYHTYHNFVGRPIIGYDGPNVCAKSEVGVTGWGNEKRKRREKVVMWGWVWGRVAMCGGWWCGDACVEKVC